MKSALKRDKYAMKKIKAVLCKFNFPLKSIPSLLNLNIAPTYVWGEDRCMEE